MTIATIRNLVLGMAAAIMLCAPAQAQSDGVTPADAADIRSVIDAQIDAFRRDDGAAAYTHAAPTIKQLFPSVERFMSMVKRGYRPVYRPQAYSFEDLRMGKDGPIQAVRITGPSNGQWLALYTFGKQPDGSWKITGVFLKKLDETVT